MGGPGAAQVVILVEIWDLNPCRYCWEWGHWVSDCQLKKARKLPLGDPRRFNLNARLKKSANCHPALLNAAGPSTTGRATGNSANVVAVQGHPGNGDHVLLDSGATDSVSNDFSLFKSLSLTSVSLIVASTDRFPVKQVGVIELKTAEGILRVSDVLYCPNIKGTIISLGKFKQLDGSVEWDGDIYTLVQRGIRFSSVEIQHRCFLKLSRAVSCVNAIEIHPRVLHERLGHLSLRLIEKTVQAGAVVDSPSVRQLKLDSCCVTCATTKATRQPVSLPSRDICRDPGDVIAADVVGPYKASVDGFQYVLTIQDLASGLVSAVPLKSKGEATKEIMRWIGQFITQSKWPVKRLRTDNALEFVSTWILWNEETGKIVTAALGDELDAQDAAVAVLESRDPYGSDSPSYEEAIKSADLAEWKAAMEEEMGSLEHHQLHQGTIPGTSREVP
ncbi:uncharacterized protein VP01_94g1 [Puccinia sorghi]|uniref:Retrovirus-related Pol polyprotein from transposon TNT 1-94-like beta-barrel domain-containing protein n=1 Tax=Puccinia sorghi TaxID=27349 RepID=A0A0L6U6F6_9BASI|nr:uncharacterized protein VP01_94g1 [Puccinia sorghi]